MTAVVDETGTVEERYAYTPYGEVTILDASFSPRSGNESDISNELLYTGRRRDPETGLQLNRYRFYASHLGRWISQDPILYLGGMNLYAYVSGMPTYYIDPSGLRRIIVSPRPIDDPFIPGQKDPGEEQYPRWAIEEVEKGKADGYLEHDGAREFFDNLRRAGSGECISDLRIGVHGNAGSIGLCSKNKRPNKSKEFLKKENTRQFKDVNFCCSCTIHIDACASGGGGRKAQEDFLQAIADQSGCAVNGFAPTRPGGGFVLGVPSRPAGTGTEGITKNPRPQTPPYRFFGPFFW